MKMKRIWALALIAAMLLTSCGCARLTAAVRTGVKSLLSGLITKGAESLTGTLSGDEGGLSGLLSGTLAGDAPAVPELPEVPAGEPAAEGGESAALTDEEAAALRLDTADVDAYLAYFAANDPYYDSGEEYVDTAVGDMPYIESQAALTAAQSFSGAAALASDIANAFGDFVSDAIETHNNIVEAASEDGLYWNDPSYIDLWLFMPLQSMELAMVASLSETYSEEELQSNLSMAFGFFGGANVTVKKESPNNYIVEYDGTTYDDDYNEHPCRTRDECRYDPETGALKMGSTSTLADGTGKFSMVEFVPLGDGQYAFQNERERLVVSFSDGVFGDFVYASLGEGAANYTAADTIWPDGAGCGAEWVTARRGELGQVFVRSGGAVTAELAGREPIVLMTE